MSLYPPDEPGQGVQYNTLGGVGFWGGDHHHHWPGSPDPALAVEASIRATHAGSIVGAPVSEWPPTSLGVHDSITVHDETTLTPYLPRAHDLDLRGALQPLTAPDAAPRLMLVVGTSCTGKTRTLYEAVAEVLPDWQLVQPSSDAHLVRILLRGLPARTVIWLDELQNKLTRLSDGVIAAKSMEALLSTRSVGRLLFVGTIWPHELHALQQRPSPEEAAAGAGAIRDVLGLSFTIVVPDTFSKVELADAPADPRLKIAIETASRASVDNQALKVAQVLAGGSQLVRRLRGDPSEPGAFSPGARAVVRAAGDLRRCGMPNPLPSWALEGASIGYLRGHVPPPGSDWFETALVDLTAAATLENPLTGPPTLDIHIDGVPALTPVGGTQPDGALTECYHMHDFLFEDHVLENGEAPTAATLWDTLVRNSSLIPDRAAPKLARDAEGRGLYVIAAALLEVSANRGYARNARTRARAMIETVETVNRPPRVWTPRPSSGRREDLARRIDALALAPGTTEFEELRELAATGSRRAIRALVEVLEGNRLDVAANEELLRLADRGVRAARRARVLDQRISKLRSRLLRGRGRAGPVLFGALARRDGQGDCDELVTYVHAARPAAAAALMTLYRARVPTGRLVGLDVDANPVFVTAPATSIQRNNEAGGS